MDRIPATSIVILGLLALSYGQRFRSKCPQIPTMDGFNITDYMGTWYENRKFFVLNEIHLKCITDYYELIDERSFRIVTTGVRYITGDTTTNYRRALLQDPASGELAIKRYASIPPVSYSVIDTDYTSYSLVYTCTDYTAVSTEIAWILVRDRSVELTNDLRRRLFAQLRAFDVSPSKFEVTDQDDCD